MKKLIGLAAILLANSALASADARIVNGTVANYSQWNFIVQLNINIAGKTAFCGGSYIGNNKVLTAAHCVKDSTAADITVIGGSEKLNNGRESAVTAISIHPSFNMETQGYDFAVLHLASNLSIGELDIADQSLVDSLVGQEVQVAGWGTQTNGLDQLATNLRFAEQVVTSSTACQSYYGSSNIGAWSICAYDATVQADACQGDSGGPLVYRGNGLVSLVGVVSYGDGCGKKNAPAVYANTAHVKDWLDSVTGNGDSTTVTASSGANKLGFGSQAGGFGLFLLAGFMLLRRRK